jgi:hypothetical protein
MIKNKFIKGLLWCIVGMIYYGLVAVVYDDSQNNAKDIETLEAHIAILELDVVKLQDKLDATQKLSKVLRENCGEPNADDS